MTAMTIGAGISPAGFLDLPVDQQVEALRAMPDAERRVWFRTLALDDAAAVLREVDPADRAGWISLLDTNNQNQVQAILAYAEDDAGGLMNPAFARVRPDLTVDEALTYLRRQSRERNTHLLYTYVLDTEQRVLGVVSFRALFRAPPNVLVRDVMRRDPMTVPDDLDQEHVARMFKDTDLVALPVVDGNGRMKGVVTMDDVLDVVDEEATEDIQKLGGTEALDAPYIDTAFWTMMRARAGWLVVLFVGEMLTATAMAWFEDEIHKAVVLALFIPLIISSGGNSGSQASTLVVRSLALGEIRLGQWARVFRRELAAGLVLGTILASVGFLRVALWPSREALYGPHYLRIAAVVAVSLVGVVMWGTVSGSMLPLLLRRLGLDPASASAPFVATLVDVAGLVIYFTTASVFLSGVLL